MALQEYGQFELTFCLGDCQHLTCPPKSLKQIYIATNIVIVKTIHPTFIKHYFGRDDLTYLLHVGVILQVYIQPHSWPISGPAALARRYGQLHLMATRPMHQAAPVHGPCTAHQPLGPLHVEHPGEGIQGPS